MEYFGGKDRRMKCSASFSDHSRHLRCDDKHRPCSHPLLGLAACMYHPPRGLLLSLVSTLWNPPSFLLCCDRQNDGIVSNKPLCLWLPPETATQVTPIASIQLSMLRQFDKVCVNPNHRSQVIYPHPQYWGPHSTLAAWRREVGICDMLNIRSSILTAGFNHRSVDLLSS